MTAQSAIAVVPVADPRIEQAIGLLQRAIRAGNQNERELERELVIDALVVLSTIAIA